MECLICVIFRRQDVQDVGCSECGMFGVWDVCDV